MTTLSETQPATPRSTHLRAYLAGTGATGALIAGGVIVFLSLAAFVAFKGIPFGGSGGQLRSISVGVQAGEPGRRSRGDPRRRARCASRRLPFPARRLARAAALEVPAGPAAATAQVAARAVAPTSARAAAVRIPPGGGTARGPARRPPRRRLLAHTGPSSTRPVTEHGQPGGQHRGNEPLRRPTSGVAGTVDNTVTNTGNDVGSVAGEPTLGDDVRP